MNVGEKINQLIGTYKSKRSFMPAGPKKVYSGVISVETVIADLEQLKDLSTIEYSHKPAKSRADHYRDDLQVRVSISLENKIFPVTMYLSPKEVAMLHEQMDNQDALVSIPEKGLVIRPSDIIRIVPVEEVNNG